MGSCPSIESLLSDLVTLVQEKLISEYCNANIKFDEIRHQRFDVYLVVRLTKVRRREKQNLSVQQKCIRKKTRSNSSNLILSRYLKRRTTRRNRCESESTQSKSHIIQEIICFFFQKHSF